MAATGAAGSKRRRLGEQTRHEQHLVVTFGLRMGHAQAVTDSGLLGLTDGSFVNCTDLHKDCSHDGKCSALTECDVTLPTCCDL